MRRPRLAAIDTLAVQFQPDIPQPISQRLGLRLVPTHQIGLGQFHDFARMDVYQMRVQGALRQLPDGPPWVNTWRRTMPRSWNSFRMR